MCWSTESGAVAIVNRGRSGSLLFSIRSRRSAIRYRVSHVVLILRSRDLLAIRRSLHQLAAQQKSNR